MSIKDCVEKLVATSQISRAIADEALGLFDRAKGQFSTSMGPASADAAAALAVARDMEAGAKKLKYQAGKQALAWAEVERRTLEHPKGPVAGLMSQLVRDIWEKGGENVQTKSEVIWAQLAKHFEAGMNAFAPGITGQTKEQLKSLQNLIREVFGVDTGDRVAKAAASGLTKATTEAVDRVKAAGKNFAVNEDWRVPQSWDAARLRKFSLDEFKRDFQQEVDRGALTLWDRDSGAPIPHPLMSDFILERAYNDIRAGGGTSGTFAPETRTFQFSGGSAGAEAWLRLQGKYGPGDNIMGMLTGHLNRMAREIALSEVIGPNHGAILRAAMPYLDQAEGKLSTIQRSNPLRLLESRNLVERTYDVLTGKANAVEGPVMAGIFGALRSISTAAQLKGAILSSIPGDSVTAAFATNAVGMPVTRLIEATAREVAKGGKASKALASRLNLVAHSAMEYSHGYRFFQDQIAGPESFKWLATTMIRAQGLQAWTELIKRTFSMEMMGHLADHMKYDMGGIAKVNQPLANFLDRHQISAAEWDALRSTKPVTVDGATFLDSTAISDKALQEKLLGAVIEERAFAMLEPDARIRARATGAAPAGTLLGEISRSLFLFKSFSMTMAATHVMRIATQGPIESRIWNAVAFTTFSALAGALSMQAKNLVYGKDPQSMTSPSFWAQAVIQGGGLGIYGDLINSSFSRSGRSPIADLGGPVAGMAEDAARLSSGQFRKLFEGKDTTFGAEAVRTLRRYTPGTFYTKLAIDRLIFDQIQMLADKDYRGSFHRMEQRLRSDTGQQFWFRPGQTTPDRAPDFGLTH